MKWRRYLSCGLVPALLVLSSISPVQAQNVAVPQSPDDPAIRQQWHSPSARPGESDAQLSVELLRTSAEANAPIAVGEDITFDLLLRNDTDEAITNIQLTPQRADAASSVAGARQLLAAPHFGYGYYGASEDIGTLYPGEQREIMLTVGTRPEADSTFSIISAGVYPVLFSAMGATSTSGAIELLTTERTLIAVTDDEAEPEEEELPGMTVVYPITAEVDLIPGETGQAPDDPPLLLASEDLSSELARGGRLDQLLNNYELYAPKESTCVAVDPELLSVVDRMSSGYTVANSRELPQRPQRLRDSWGDGDEDVEKHTGQGSGDAQRWLERFKEITAEHCVVALPWANADVNAVASTHNMWVAREALERGPLVVEDILGREVTNNVVIAPAGWVSEDAAAIAGWADTASSPLRDQSMASLFQETEENVWVSQPEADVSVLMADNTAWDGAPSRFHHLREHVIGVGYDASLAATLMASGDIPAIAGYSDPATRYDPLIDSLTSRALTAGNAMHLAASTANGDILAMGPLAQSPEGARSFLRAAEAIIGTNAEGMSLEEYIQIDELGPLLPEAQHGAPYNDPTVYTDTEITRATQQAQYTDGLTRILTNSPNLALTPYGYTLPLRRDLLRSFGSLKRDAMATFEAGVEKTNYILTTSGEMLAALRGSITLLPPGNVYTRTSESSPLLIVAENRLPLPVTARLAYENPQGGQLILPETIHIPASGSITVSMTADLPEDADQTHIRLWLATPEEKPQAISSVVDITVQTRATTRDLLILSLGIMAAFVAVFLLRKRRS